MRGLFVRALRVCEDTGKKGPDAGLSRRYLCRRGRRRCADGHEDSPVRPDIVCPPTRPIYLLYNLSRSLGRMSFRAIKSKRDYLRKGQSASWMYMSRLAAIKEYAFMKVRFFFPACCISALWTFSGGIARLTGSARLQVLHEHGFPVPQPIDQSRHCLIMELIDAFPL